MSAEITRRAFPNSDVPIVSYGLPFPETCAKHVETTFKASRVYIIASGSLARNMDALTRLQNALDGKVVGTRMGLKPHTQLDEVLEMIQEAESLDTDIIVTLGAGTTSDAAKIVAFGLANAVTSMDDLKRLPNVFDTQQLANAKAPTVPVIAIPTSLSGGEYTIYGGATDPVTKIKYQFSSPCCGPALVILDAALALTTPLSIWLSTVMRAVDHCVKTLSSLISNKLSDEHAMRGLACLVTGLLKTKRNSQDEEGRHLCQLGVIDAMVHLQQDIRLGASHGIGHMLGPLGVGHGETSCILLPAVCNYNAAHSAPALVRQQDILPLLWKQPTVRAVLEARGLKNGEADLGDVIDAVVRELGLPRSMEEVGVGWEKMDRLAENSLHDFFLKTNAVPLLRKEQVMEVLELTCGKP